MAARWSDQVSHQFGIEEGNRMRALQSQLRAVGCPICLLSLLLHLGCTEQEPGQSTAPVEKFRERGLNSFNAGEYDKALSEFSEAIRIDPRDAKAYLFRGGAHDKKRDYDKAIADYTEVIRLEPTNARALHQRGASFQAKGE